MKCYLDQETLSLFNAVNSGSIERVRQAIRVIEGSGDVSEKMTQTNDHGLTVMHVAAIQGRQDIIELFVSYNASLLTQQTIDGLAPLHCAVAAGHVECIRCIHRLGGDVVLSQLMTNGFSAAHLAVRHERLVSLVCLAELECDLYQTDEESKTALHYAAECGHESCCAYLIYYDREVIDLATNDGKTPMYFASSNGHIGCVNLLLRNGADPMLPIESVLLTPWGIAAANKNEDIVRLTIVNFEMSEKDNKKNPRRYCSALVRSMQGGDNADIAKYLLDEFQSEMGPVHYMARDGSFEELQLITQNPAVNLKLQYGEKKISPLHMSASIGRIDMVRLLLDLDAEQQNIKDIYKRTALHLSASNGHHDVVKLLVEQDGSQLEEVDCNGRTALCYAVARGQREIVEYLLQNGAVVLSACRPFEATKKGTIAALAHAACDLYLDVLRLIWSHFSALDAVSYHDKSQLWWQLVKSYVNRLQGPRGDVISGVLNVEQKSVLDYLMSCGEDNFFPLHVLAVEVLNNDSQKRYSLKLFRVILQGCTNINITDTMGSTALHHAVFHKKTDVADLLIKAGANVNVKNIDGATPLHYAPSHEKDDAANLLINAGVKINVQDNSGFTALHYAVSQQSAAVTQSLLVHGADRGLLTNAGHSVEMIARASGDTEILSLLVVAQLREEPSAGSRTEISVTIEEQKDGIDPMQRDTLSIDQMTKDGQEEKGSGFSAGR